MSKGASAILVVGASSDIGCEVIRGLDDGESIFLAHYNRGDEKIRQLQSEIRSKIVPLQADLSEEAGVMSLISAIREHCTFPDKIVHLAAPRVSYTRFKDIVWTLFQTELDVELRSIVLILNAFLPDMAKNRTGKIVFVLSSYCFGVPPKALSHYTTAKYALLGLMKSLASEYADKFITFNAVSPSMADTAFLEHVPEKIRELTAAAHPLKRIATKRDIAPAIVFLLSDQAGYVNGINIPVTGGGIY